MALVETYSIGRDGAIVVESRGREFEVTVESTSGILELKTYVFSSKDTASAFAQGLSIGYVVRAKEQSAASKANKRRR